MPTGCSTVVDSFLKGVLEYYPGVDVKDSDKQTIRGLRSLLELPFLNLNEEGYKTLINELEILKEKEEISRGAKEQVGKMVRNARFGGACNRFVRGFEEDKKIPSLVQEVTKKVTSGKLNGIPEFIQSRPITEGRGDSGLLMEKNLLVPFDDFRKNHTDNGVLYHGTPSLNNVLYMMRNGLVRSTGYQGTRAALGSGAYSTKDLNTANAYTDFSGLVIPLSVKETQDLRILDLEAFRESDLFNNLSEDDKKDLNRYLFDHMDVDIILVKKKEGPCIIQNGDAVRLPKNVITLIKAELDARVGAIEENLKKEVACDTFSMERFMSSFLPNGYIRLLRIMDPTFQEGSFDKRMKDIFEKMLNQGDLHKTKTVLTLLFFEDQLDKDLFKNLIEEARIYEKSQDLDFLGFKKISSMFSGGLGFRNFYELAETLTKKNLDKMLILKDLDFLETLEPHEFKKVIEKLPLLTDECIYFIKFLKNKNFFKEKMRLCDLDGILEIESFPSQENMMFFEKIKLPQIEKSKQNFKKLCSLLGNLTQEICNNFEKLNSFCVFEERNSYYFLELFDKVFAMKKEDFESIHALEERGVWDKKQSEYSLFWLLQGGLIQHENFGNFLKFCDLSLCKMSPYHVKDYEYSISWFTDQNIEKLLRIKDLGLHNPFDDFSDFKIKIKQKLTLTTEQIEFVRIINDLGIPYKKEEDLDKIFSLKKEHIECLQSLSKLGIKFFSIDQVINKYLEFIKKDNIEIIESLKSFNMMPPMDYFNSSDFKRVLQIKQRLKENTLLKIKKLEALSVINTLYINYDCLIKYVDFALSIEDSHIFVMEELLKQKLIMMACDSNARKSILDSLKLFTQENLDYLKKLRELNLFTYPIKIENFKDFIDKTKEELKQYTGKNISIEDFAKKSSRSFNFLT